MGGVDRVFTVVFKLVAWVFTLLARCRCIVLLPLEMGVSLLFFGISVLCESLAERVVWGRDNFVGKK